MNYRLVLNQLGLLFLVLSGILLAMAFGFQLIEVLLQHELDAASRNALLASGAIGLTFGGGLWVVTRSGGAQLGRREAFLLVGLTWLLGAAFCALPYFFWAHLHQELAAEHPFRSFTDCYFESMSGLTTTGASVLTDVEAIPRSLLLWRALTQWLGGLGIVVLFVAVLPALGTTARKLFRAETTGVTKQGMRPQVRDTARILWYIYLSLTVAQTVALRVAGMDWFDALCHSFTSLATGGFSTKNASIAAYDSVAIDLIIILFMAIGGVNFVLYYQLIRGRVSAVWRDPEFRLYVSLLLMGTVIVAALAYGQPMQSVSGEEIEGTAFQSVRHGMFDVVSMSTTTGFATAEYDLWTTPAKIVIGILMFVGGCAGSTAGGLKVIRLWVILKTLHAELERSFRPSVVRPIRVGDTTINEELRLSTLAFFAAFFLVMVIGSALLMILEPQQMDLASAMTGTLACMTTVGPGFGLFGGAENYGWLSPASKWVLIAAMIIGRLEVFTIIVLVTPRFWRES